MAEGWPHDCKTSGKTWVRTSNTQFNILCSFCRKIRGQWNYSSIDEIKVFPQEDNAKWTAEQKKKMA